MTGPTWITRLRESLLDYFRRTRDDRDMPWRKTEDPYAIWVAEVMLQQTRVETVIPYFESWMSRFPTVEALADADSDEVLKRWEGLGYYSRARNLHRAARTVRERYRGTLPRTMEGLRSLPGIGAYTAGAVGSIAFGFPVPAVDGNVRRVAARLLDRPDPSPRELEETVGGWVPEQAPGDFNQALMELGATICTPKAPACDDCPVEGLCAARAAGTVAERPVKRRRAKVRREVRAVTVAVRGGAPGQAAHHGIVADAQGSDHGSHGLELALRRRSPEGLLAGMWEFPSVPLDRDADDPEGAGAAAEGSPSDSAGDPDRGAGSGLGTRGMRRSLPPVRHAFTHIHVTYRPLLVRLPPGAAPPDGCAWYAPEAVRALPLPVAQQSIVESALAALHADAAGED